MKYKVPGKFRLLEKDALLYFNRVSALVAFFEKYEWETLNCERKE